MLLDVYIAGNLVFDYVSLHSLCRVIFNPTIPRQAELRMDHTRKRYPGSHSKMGMGLRRPGSIGERQMGCFGAFVDY